jgi:predicted N-acyltransferase
LVYRQNTLDNYYFKIVNSFNDISRESWDSLLSEDSSPFLSYDWINSLELSGCATFYNGWQPVHLLLLRNESCGINNSLHSSSSSSNVIEAVEENEIIIKKDFGNCSLVSAMPLYLKYHSNGEFIFDQTWANFAENVLGIQYYPKVLLIYKLFYLSLFIVCFFINCSSFFIIVYFLFQDLFN